MREGWESISMRAGAEDSMGGTASVEERGRVASVAAVVAIAEDSVGGRWPMEEGASVEGRRGMAAAAASMEARGGNAPARTSVETATTGVASTSIASSVDTGTSAASGSVAGRPPSLPLPPLPPPRPPLPRPFPRACPAPVSPCTASRRSMGSPIDLRYAVASGKRSCEGCQLRTREDRRNDRRTSLSTP